MTGEAKQILGPKWLRWTRRLLILSILGTLCGLVINRFIVTRRVDSEIKQIGATPGRLWLLGIIPGPLFDLDFGLPWADVDRPPWMRPATDRGFHELTEIVRRTGDQPQILSVAGGDMTSTGFMELALFESVQQLGLSATNVKNDDLAIIAALPKLVALDLGATRVDSRGIEHLALLPHLSSLSLWRTQISDDAVPALAKMQKLRYLNVVQTKMTAAGVSQLRQLRPDIKIYE